MTKKFVIVLKYLAISVGLLIGVISCEKDFTNVGVNIVDNNIFSTDKYTSEIIAYSQGVENVRANGLSDYLLGVQRDGLFGKLEASIVAQLSLATANPDFGENAVIDTVIVDIPYHATLDGTQTDIDGVGVPKFKLDSVWTSGNNYFQLNVFELKTALFSVDQDEPTKPKIYYSDYDFQKNESTPLFSGLISPNENDTMTVIKRFKYPNSNFPDLTAKEEYRTDTIKKTDLKPSLKIPFDKEMIKTLFQDNATTGIFDYNSSFQTFFKGLYLEALEHDNQGDALMNLKMSDATMTIYFSNDVQKDEGDTEDLNGNGINGETDVWVRNPQSFIFPFSGIKSNIYSRDESGSAIEPFILTPNEINGEEKLFVQGASGANAVIKLFGDDNNNNGTPDELEALRSNNWLINQAKLVVYIDQVNTAEMAPQQLYLYNVGVEDLNEDGELDDTQILDAMPQSILGIDGELVRDADGVPEKYSFLMTDYISELLKEDTEMALHDLGIKVFDNHDIPDPRFTTDTLIHKFNSNPKGLVLKGNLSNTEEQRIKLEIYYTKKN